MLFAIRGATRLLRSMVVPFGILLGILTAVTVGAQQPGTTLGTPADSEAMAARVRAEYLHAWQGYRTYAWGHDALMPLSKQPHDWYGVSLHMSEIDGLDTMILMGLDKEAAEARQDIDKHLSFNQDIYVKNFEITIRCLGGLLSEYEATNDPQLLKLATDLGNRLLPAFHSPTGMPYEFVNLRTGKVRGAVTNPAEVALLPEFGTLSRLTGNPLYYNNAKRAMTELWRRRSSLDLVGLGINVETGEWTDSTSSISGGIDSFDEYLLKSWLLFGDRDCLEMWRKSIVGINKYLAEQTRLGLWYGQADMRTGARTTHEYGALDAFFPALLALSGDLPRAEALQRSSFQMWTLYGIEPDTLDYIRLATPDPGYPLRPEIIESTYYLHHLTGDPIYLHMGQDYLDSLIRWCRTPVAYAALTDVRTKQQKDEMESFFFAETLKYLYLLYAPRDTVDWTKFVFNTEAHPLKRFTGPAS
jgi:ER degradation enhancer, mannosidase alpha-like 2